MLKIFKQNILAILLWLGITLAIITSLFLFIQNNQEKSKSAGTNAATPVSVSQTASTNSVNPGDEVDFEVTYTNDDSVLMENVKLTTSLSFGLDYIDNTCFPGCRKANSRHLSWHIGDLSPGQSGTIKYSAQVNSGTSFKYFHSYTLGSNKDSPLYHFHTHPLQIHISSPDLVHVSLQQ